MVNRVADQSLTTDHRTGQSIPPIGRGLTIDHCAHQGTDHLFEEGGLRDGRGRSPSDRTDTLPAPIPDGGIHAVSVARSPAGDTSVCVVGNVPVTTVTPVPWAS